MKWLTTLPSCALIYKRRQQARVQNQTNDDDDGDDDDEDDNLMAFFSLLAYNPVRHLHPENPNYYQNHPVYAPKRNDEYLTPFTRDSFYRTASLYQSSAFYIHNMHAQLIIPSYLNYISRNT